MEEGQMTEVRALQFLAANIRSKPNEDAVLVSSESLILAVADGVTRAVSEGVEYPDPSHAHTCADLFCHEAVHYVGKYKNLFAPDVATQKAFSVANNAIRDLNAVLGTGKDKGDLAEDLFGCQAVLGFLSQSPPFVLHYGYLDDCGLAVFNKDLFPVFLSERRVQLLELFRDGWGFPTALERRQFWRRALRNSPNSRYFTYGSLTGEEEALEYLKIGSLNLYEGDLAIFFSDGIFPFLFDKRFREVVNLQLRNANYETRVIEECIARLIPELQARGATNLDDDKAFIALQLA